MTPDPSLLIVEAWEYIVVFYQLPKLKDICIWQLIMLSFAWCLWVYVRIFNFHEPTYINLPWVHLQYKVSGTRYLAFALSVLFCFREIMTSYMRSWEGSGICQLTSVVSLPVDLFVTVGVWQRMFFAIGFQEWIRLFYAVIELHLIGNNEEWWKKFVDIYRGTIVGK